MSGGLVSVLVGFARANYQLFKRCFDFTVASIALIVLSPLFLIIGLLIKIDSEGPVFFRQDRVGQGGEIFKIWKFRTMRKEAELETGPVWAQDNDPRITRIGEFLRKSHLDELPQLINVFRGQMSLIGPRPERPEFIKTIAEEIPNFSFRLGVKPGITGLAQVRYRYGASIKDAARKLRYDLFYIKRMCWFLDFRIILWTIERVLTGEGAR
jgi:exopolysaccharide biosynthesis polyprenyl glycosylphosphotransferase